VASALISLVFLLLFLLLILYAAPASEQSGRIDLSLNPRRDLCLSSLSSADFTKILVGMRA